MPITAEKKQLLVEALNGLEDIERVWVAGAVYDSFVAARLPWTDLFVVSKCMSENISWGQLGQLSPELANQFATIKVMIIRGIEEILVKQLPDLLARQSPETRQLVAEILKDIDSLELVKIAGASYNGFVAAGLSQDKAFAFSKHMFAKIPWARLPEGLKTERVKITWGVREKLLDTLPDIIQTIVDAPVEEHAQPQEVEIHETATSQVTSQVTLIAPVNSDTPLTVTSGAPATISSSPPITPTTRSQIDDLDEEASMHGMDTESPPEGGRQPEQEEIRVESAEDNSPGFEEAGLEEAGIEEPGNEDVTDEKNLPEVSASTEALTSASTEAPASPEVVASPETTPETTASLDPAPSSESNGHNQTEIPTSSSDVVPTTTVPTP